MTTHSNVLTEWHTLMSGEREMRAYLAKPAATGAVPSIVVVHEAFGLDEHIQNVTRRLAAEGYVTIAPDLFSLDEFGRNVQPEEILQLFGVRFSLPADQRGDPAALEEALDRLPAAQASRLREIGAWSARRDPATLVAPLEHAVDWMRLRDDTTDTVGAIGFCLGGGMTLRLAFAGAPLQAAAPYYGANPPLEQASQVRCPLLLMYGLQDPFIMPGVSALLGAVQQAGLTYEVHIYEQAGHAFLNDTRPQMYNEAAARDAWGKTRDFFARHLS